MEKVHPTPKQMYHFRQYLSEPYTTFQNIGSCELKNIKTKKNLKSPFGEKYSKIFKINLIEFIL